VKLRGFVIAFGVLFMFFAVFAIVQPSALTRMAHVFLPNAGLWAAVALRVGVGILLWMSAGLSRMPRTLRVLGALFVIGGLALPVLGLERLQGIAEWGAGQEPVVLRVVAVAAFGLGAFIVWSMWPRREEG